LRYQLITTPEEISRAAARLSRAPFIGVDTETTGLDPHTSRLRLLQLAVPEESFIVDLFQTPVAAVQPLLDLLAAPQPIKIAHNAKFDAKFLLKHGDIRLRGIFDTYLASQLISASAESDRHGLAAVTLRFLGHTVDKEEQRSDWSGTLSAAQLEYAARDAQVLLPLRERQQEKLTELELLRVAQIEFDCVMSLAALEIAGVYLDAAKWRALIGEVRAKYEVVAEALQRVLAATVPQLTLFDTPVRINLDSPAQLQEALKQLGIELSSTREWHLQRHAAQFPILHQVLEYRHLSKALSSYGEHFLDYINPATGRIHADFRQLGTPTGRIAASQPSLQQVPHDAAYRSCFTAPAGRKLVIADYSQIEMRILADFANDAALLAAFASGADLHRTTSAQMLGLKLEDVTPQQREAAKRLNYGLVYGMGAEGLAGQINSTVKEAEALIEKYFAAYSGVARYLKDAADTAVRAGRSRTASGRLWIYQFDTKHPETGKQQLGALKRVGKNTPIQGSASDIFKRAMTLVDAALLPHDAQIVNSIHDEIVVECAAPIAEEIKALVTEAMTAAGREFLQRVPVVVEAVVADAWLKK
jgi:DNA polymerase I-like protein with 3'-5' exonuclease and polymerase domains